MFAITPEAGGPFYFKFYAKILCDRRLCFLLSKTIDNKASGPLPHRRIHTQSEYLRFGVFFFVLFKIIFAHFYGLVWF